MGTLNTMILTAHALYDNPHCSKNLEKIGSSIVGAVVAGSRRILIASNSGTRAANFEYEIIKKYTEQLYPPEDIEICFLDLEELSKVLYKEIPRLKKYEEIYRSSTGPFHIGVARDIAVQYFSGEEGYVLVSDDGITPPYNISRRIDAPFYQLPPNSPAPPKKYTCFVFDIIGSQDGGERNRTDGEIYFSKNDQTEILKNIHDEISLEEIINYRYNHLLRNGLRVVSLSGITFSGGRHIVPSTGSVVLEFQPPASWNEDFNGFLLNAMILNPIYSANPVRVINKEISVWKELRSRSPYGAALPGSREIVKNYREKYGYIKNDKDVSNLADQLEDIVNREFERHPILSSFRVEYEAWSDLIRYLPDIAEVIRNYEGYRYLI